VEPHWHDLNSKGFLVVREFLNDAEREELNRDYALTSSPPAPNNNYNLKGVSAQVIARFEPKLQAVSSAVQLKSGINANLTTGGVYFAIERGIEFPWHQDHESYFLFHEHHHYLNFYIPIEKPDSKRTNVCVAPFDRLREAVPEHYERLLGNGATNFTQDGSRMEVFEVETGERYVLPTDLEHLAIAPELSEGDLLLMRGDLIHRTQDTATARVAVSFRRINADTIVRKDRILAGSPEKHAMIWKNVRMYSPILQCFTRQMTNELTVRQLDGLLKTASSSHVF
jgi:Phytanoyl-CoA dioxygenase (PhyH)